MFKLKVLVGALVCVGFLGTCFASAVVALSEPADGSDHDYWVLNVNMEADADTDSTAPAGQKPVMELKFWGAEGGGFGPVSFEYGQSCTSGTFTYTAYPNGCYWSGGATGMWYFGANLHQPDSSFVAGDFARVNIIGGSYPY